MPDAHVIDPPDASPDTAALEAALSDLDEAPLPDVKSGVVELLVPIGDVSAIQVRELTGRDEEALARVLLAQDEMAFSNEVARRGLEMVRRNTVWTDEFKAVDIVSKMILGDRDRSVNMIRDVTFGPELELTAQCLTCRRNMEMTYNVHEPPVREADAEHTIWAAPSGNTYRIRWVTVEDQEYTYSTGAATMEERNTLYLQRSVLTINDQPPRSTDWSLDLPLKERRALIEHITDHTPGLLFEEVKADCTCGAEVPVVVSHLQMFR